MDASQHTANASSDQTSRSGSPIAPPFSPITPVMPNSLPQKSDYQHFPPTDPHQLPPTSAVSLNDNPDAIALRSAISVLQLQRQQTLRDLKTLESRKQTAVADPEQFARDLSAGKIKTAPSGVLGSQQDFTPSPDNKRSLDSESQVDSESEKSAQSAAAFDNIPGPQNIVRCPPINWARYHVEGRALDKLHEEQRRRPTNDRDRKGGTVTGNAEHVIAAPYNPWLDVLGPAENQMPPDA